MDLKIELAEPAKTAFKKNNTKLRLKITGVTSAEVSGPDKVAGEVSTFDVVPDKLYSVSLYGIELRSPVTFQILKADPKDAATPPDWKKAEPVISTSLPVVQ